MKVLGRARDRRKILKKKENEIEKIQERSNKDNEIYVLFENVL